MKGYKKGLIGVCIWVILFLILQGGGSIIQDILTDEPEITYDSNMKTKKYDIEATIDENNVYHITENIKVDLNDRHGIYRYIPMAGASRYVDKDGKLHKIPYTADIDLEKYSDPVEVEDEGGTKVIRFGDEDATIDGNKDYSFSYTFEPKFQNSDYPNVYYNIYPSQWQNNIPEGSTFKITLPKKINKKQVRFYTGNNADGSKIIQWKLDQSGTVLTGELTKELKYGTAFTLFANVGNGYFKSVGQIPSSLNVISIIVSIFALAIAVILFVLFGRDEQIITSIQYQPPEGLDSAAVGYIIDGRIEDRDIISLIIYWADKGYLRIHDKEDGISLEKLKALPKENPEYERTFFDEIFAKGTKVTLESLKYNMSATIGKSRGQISDDFTKEKAIYTTSSKIARVIAVLLSIIPLGVFVAMNSMYINRGIPYLDLIIMVLVLFGVGIFCYEVDSWYGTSKKARIIGVIVGILTGLLSIGTYAGRYLEMVSSGLAFSFIPALVLVVIATIVIAVLAAFMHKRTHQCVEWMGRLLGLRDFIETAEKDRMEAMATDRPQWFYHVLPYAYVMGVSDIFAKKLEGISIEPPQWYRSDRTFYEDGYFSCYYFHTSLMSSMDEISQNITAVEVNDSDDGGGFGGGGGFSGGGFGGGGGGSW